MVVYLLPAAARYSSLSVSVFALVERKNRNDKVTKYHSAAGYYSI